MKAAVVKKLAGRARELGAEDIERSMLRLARSHQTLEALLSAISEGVILVDEGGRIDYFNEAAAVLMGLPPSALGRSLDRFLRGLETIDLDEAESEARLIELEVTYPEPRFLEVRMVPLRGSSGETLGRGFLVHDATPRRLMARRAAESGRIDALTSLAASVAHELGNPLNSFNIQLQLMERELKKLPTNDRMTEAVRVARQEVQRLDVMVRHFLKAVRPAPPEFRLLDLNLAVEETIDFFREEIADREIAVECDLDADLPLAFFDGDQIRQAFANLVKNALYAMRPGGTLRVTTRRDGDWITADFQDTGAGMDQEIQKRLFEPFQTTKPGGTGLGLVIVLRILRDHGGEVEIDSQAGRGTSVRLRLPLPGSRTKLLEDVHTEPVASEAAEDGLDDIERAR